MPAPYRYSTIALLLLSAAPALAQETITVGGENKRAFGTPVAFQNGDRACHITLKDDRGVTFNELADFELCAKEGSLKDRRVALTYRPTRILAASCQGNPDCRKSDMVALVVGAKPAPLAASAFEAPQTSFCTPAETIVFSCRTSATRLVSVCASPDAAQGKGYVQYRTGKPDPKEPLELVLPATRVPPPQAASGEALAFSGGGGAWLRLSAKPFAYVVYTGIGKWGPRGEIQEKAGVTVERDGKPIANLKCMGKPVSLLGPDWFAKAGITDKDQDFDLPD